MKRIVLVLSAVCLTASLANANLLINGNFNDPATGDPPTGWSPWSWGSGWANHENNGGVTYDGSFYLVTGGLDYDTGGGGFYQIVPATAGIDYTLTVLSGADAWWLPYGEMRMFFLDAGDVELGNAVAGTVDPAVYGQNYDIAHPWSSYSLTATAPSGTTQIKVEFAEPHGTGSVWFENADLTAVPEPGTLGLVIGGLALLLGSQFRRRAPRS